jgi:hypothetical protein
MRSTSIVPTIAPPPTAAAARLAGQPRKVPHDAGGLASLIDDPSAVTPTGDGVSASDIPR